MALSLTPLTPPPPAVPTPTGGPPVVITTPGGSTTSDVQSSTTGSSSSSLANTVTSTSSSSTSSPSSSSSSSSQGPSAGARAGIALGIVFFLILSVLLYYNLKRRYQRAREKVNDEPALATSKVTQYVPLQSVAFRGRNPPPPPRLNTTYPASADTPGAAPLSSHNSHRNSYPTSAQNRYSTLSQVTDPQPIATQDVPTLPNPQLNTTYPASADISRAAPLSSHNSLRNSYPVSAQNRYSTFFQATDPQRIATQDVPTLPNPHDPFSAPARPASQYSPTYSVPHDTSASAPMMASSDVPAVGSSSNSQSELQLSALHADMNRHQKELEFEHEKRSLDQAQELQEPPPQYPS
ncbi:hypothetical protein F4604DRAFT_1927989 [Suillus subluteus]|nr:hypothetical protein F4604DRAFT_1927989 [Suillus subluteus]